MKLRYIFGGVGLVLLVLVILAGVKVAQIRKMMAFKWAVPPETISSAVARTEQWQETLSAVGSINAAQGVIVAPEVPGTVSEIDFESGATVHKGDLLVKLDTSAEDAQLRSAEAQEEWARVSADRLEKLRADN